MRTFPLVCLMVISGAGSPGGVVDVGGASPVVAGNSGASVVADGISRPLVNGDRGVRLKFFTCGVADRLTITTFSPSSFRQSSEFTKHDISQPL